MPITAALHSRSGGRCELCASQEPLQTFDVLPNAGPSSDTSLFLCRTCIAQITQPDSLDLQHWYPLGDSMWSEHPAVQVMAYRVLKALEHEPWAQDLLGQLYLDDDKLRWAEAAPLKSEGDSIITRDSNGTQLATGDTVTLIKDLVVKGANFTAKRGTTVKNISLTDDPKFIEGNVNGTRIVLVAAYLKKA